MDDDATQLASVYWNTVGSGKEQQIIFSSHLPPLLNLDGILLVCDDTQFGECLK